MYATLLLGAALLGATAAAENARDDDGEDDDPALFMVVVQHADGGRCAAALLSLRTALTTAHCARVHALERGAELWALAATQERAAAGARRVARLAIAGDGRDASNPAYDMAVLELEAPFGRAARAQPILMQNDVRHNESHCHAIRTLPPRATAERARYRVCSLRVAPDRRCAAHIPHWAAARSRLLCLVSDDDEMCERDLGGAVVCGGKLHGVLSAVGDERAGGAGRCGRTLAAQAVARWRRFLHCAHTLRQCGRGSCEKDCIEQRLLPHDYGDGDADDEDVRRDVPAAAPPAAPPAAQPAALSPTEQIYDTLVTYSVTPSSVAASRPSRPSRPAPLTASVSPPRTTLAHFAFFNDENVSISGLAPEFEPNRADFKAGEYGDNAADYVGEETPPPRAAPTTASALERARVSRVSRPLSPTPARGDVGGPPAPALQFAPVEAAASSAACRLAAASVVLRASFDILVWKINDHGLEN